MVNFLCLAENTYIGARKWIKPTFFKGIQYVPKTLERDVVEITQKPAIVGVPLDKASRECEYFGVDSSEHVADKISSHIKLDKAKKEWSIDWSGGEILNFGGWTINQKGIEKLKQYLCEKALIHGVMRTRIREFNLNQTAKMTCLSEIFGKSKNGCPEIHTIGLVSANGNLYILDSLGEQIPPLKDFHSMLKEAFKDFGYRKIIVSTKPQQAVTDYTCNNWTFANIESALNAIYKHNLRIETVEELNKILPEDINKILEEQYRCAIWVD